LLAARWFSPKKQALIVGLIVTIAMLGGLVAQTPLSLLSDWIGWRNALLINTGVGTLILILVWATVSDYPDDQADAHIAHREALSNMGFWPSLHKAITSPQNWLYGIYTGLLNLPIMLLGAVWGVLYLTQVRLIGKTDATNISMMIYLGTIFGSPLAGWLSDRWGKRRTPMILGALMGLIIISLILYGPDWTINQLLVLFFMLGMVTSSQVISYPAITESNDKAISGTSMGLASCLIMGIGGIAQPFTGKILDLLWDGTMLNGVPYYSEHTFLIALSSITVGFIIGLIAVLLAKETHSHSKT
jgi:sugar phosphate permease